MKKSTQTVLIIATIEAVIYAWYKNQKKEESKATSSASSGGAGGSALNNIKANQGTITNTGIIPTEAKNTDLNIDLDPVASSPQIIMQTGSGGGGVVKVNENIIKNAEDKITDTSGGPMPIQMGGGSKVQVLLNDLSDMIAIPISQM